MTAADGAHDAALATAVAAGDTAALAAIYDKYAVRLLGFCRSMLHNATEAEDCLQDVFVIAATRLGGLRQPELLRSWLFSVARHECLSRLDKRKKEILVDEVADRPSLDPDPVATTAVDVELAGLLRDAAAGLSDRDRLLLELADRQQLAGDEFAAAIGVPRSSAYTLLARARATAKKSIGALLVARTGRQQCADLDALLAGWDGELTALRRKQVSRHIENCATCDDQRSRVASLAALLGGEGEAFAARLVGLRTRILEAAAASMRVPLAAADGWADDWADDWDDGWPPSDPEFGAGDGRRRRGLLAALLVAALALLFGAVVAAGALGPVHTTTVAGTGGGAPGPLISVDVRTTPAATTGPATTASLLHSAPPTKRSTHSRSAAPSTSEPASSSPTPTPTSTPNASSSRQSTPAKPHPSHTRPTSAKPTTARPSTTKPRPSTSPSKSKATSSAPPSSPPPPPVWTLTVTPPRRDTNGIIVATDTDKWTCADPAGTGTSCSYSIDDGAAVTLTIGRQYRFDTPASCQSSIISCQFTMTSDATVTVHIS